MNKIYKIIDVNNNEIYSLIGKNKKDAENYFKTLSGIKENFTIKRINKNNKNYLNEINRSDKRS